MDMVIVPDGLATMKPDFLRSQIQACFQVWLNEDFPDGGLFGPKMHQCPRSLVVKGKIPLILLRYDFGEEIVLPKAFFGAVLSRIFFLCSRFLADAVADK